MMSMPNDEQNNKKKKKQQKFLLALKEVFGHLFIFYLLNFYYLFIKWKIYLNFFIQ